MHEGQPETPEDLLSAMDHFGIHEALVLDPLGVEANPMAGNERILWRTKDHPRLHPAWTGLMTHSRELPPPRELVTRMREEGVGALFLCYRHFDIRLEEWGVDDLLEELEASCVPLFLSPDNPREAWRSDATDWANVVRICRRFPQLPVVVSESRIYKSQRALYAALAACPNLKVDASALWLHRRVEFICREFGADHLVWSSRLPMRNPGGVLMQLDYSDISEDDLGLILGGNMRQLLSWNECAALRAAGRQGRAHDSNIRFVGDVVSPAGAQGPAARSAAQVKLPEPVDSLHRAARERLSLRGERFYDCHGHIGRCSMQHVVEDTPGDLVREMDKFGVALCCVFSLEGVVGDETYGNDQVVAAVQQHPERFVGFTLVNPNRGERLMRQELERGRDLGLRGVKLICDYQGYPTEGPLVDVACQFADEHGLLILNHNWGSPEQISRLCRTYPNACFIAGHTTTAYGEVAKEFGNLYICTCPCIDWSYPERLVEMYGADRVLFGSDLTDLPIGWGLGQIMYARIPESDKRLILGENLKALLGRALAPSRPRPSGHAVRPGHPPRGRGTRGAARKERNGHGGAGR
jgi:hypothetical protein